MKIAESLSNSIKNLDIKSFKKSVCPEISNDMIIYVCEEFFKSNNTIFKRECNKVKKRDDFVKHLLDILSKRKLPETFESLKSKFEDIKYIEKKYTEIVDSLHICPLGKESNSIQCWSQINFTEMTIANLIKKIEESIKKNNTNEIKLSHIMFLTDDYGNEIKPVSVIESIINALSSSLKMLGFTEQWFNSDYKLVIPTEVSVTDEQIYQSNVVQLLAHTWANLEKSEQIYRYFGGKVIEISKNDLPLDLEETSLKSLCRFEKTDEYIQWELLEFVAHERLNRKIAQDNWEVEDYIKNPKNNIIIDNDELKTLVTISEILNFNVNDDNSTYEDLTIMEWVRGYSVLKKLFTINNNEENNNKLKIHPSKLILELQRNGITLEKAKKFISLTSFSRDSRDLYDCPIINMEDGNLLLLKSCLVSASTPLAILSRFSSLSIQIRKKGKAFEKSIVKLFLENVGECQSFKFKRDNDEYEYDVVVVWNKTLFVIECKNTSLSHGSPIASYYFSKSLGDHIKQIKRLVDALKEYSDVFEEKFNKKLEGYNIVPILLFSQPFSMPDKIDEVIITDASTVRRFFKSEAIYSIERKFNDPQNKKVPIHKLWKGKSPTDEDFVKSLNHSFQYKSIADCAGRVRLPIMQFSNDTALDKEIITYIKPPVDSKNPYSK